MIGYSVTHLAVALATGVFLGVALMLVIQRASDPFDIEIGEAPSSRGSGFRIFSIKRLGEPEEFVVPEGWTHWHGGYGPALTVATEVYVIFRDGHVRCGPASKYDWHHRNNEHDIIAYKEHVSG